MKIPSLCSKVKFKFLNVGQGPTVIEMPPHALANTSLLQVGIVLLVGPAVGPGTFPSSF